MNILELIENNRFVLIAEIGVNHFDIAKDYGITPIEAAKMMIREAKNSGAHAVKFQSYKASKLASVFAESYWDTEEESTHNQFELFSKYDSFNQKEYEELSLLCKQIDIEFMATPFDFDSANYLNQIINVFKISSSDITNIPFIEYIAKFNKPIILSVGASNLIEIKMAVKTIRENNNQFIILLHCILEYPTPVEHTNLARINSLKLNFPDIKIGYSDHTKTRSDNRVLTTAYTLGAKIIEKHFTLNKRLPGNDHYHAMDASDIKKILDDISFTDKLLGKSELEHLEFEKNARLNARRSCVLNKPVMKGEKLTISMISLKRPGYGIQPQDIKKWIGREFNKDLLEDTILTTEMFN